MKRKGFTMIELLVVIAVIGILAAILFPVFNRAKMQAKKDSDIVNMKSIHQALKLYQNDAGGYPPLLLQVAEYNGTLKLNVDQVRRGFLYKQRIKDVTVFASSISEAKKDETVQACWPSKDPRGGGDPAETQFKGPSDLVIYTDISYNFNPGPLNGQNPNSPAEFYAYDNYDVAPTLNPGCVSPSKHELRYSLFWTEMGQAGGGPTDNNRQLGYRDPKDDTIVTWNTFFQPTAGSPKLPNHERGTIVLYLSGTAKLEDGKDIYDRSWRFGQ
ncbi:MAG: type II secretion system protein [Fimbriimonadales bacterium]